GAEDDEDLATACREAGNVILACRLITGYVARGAGYEVQYDGPIDALAEAAYEIGLVDAITSPPDEKVRQGVLYTIHQDELIPSLSVLATALFLGIPSGQVAKQLQHKRFWRYNIPILKYRVGTEMTSAAVGQDYGTVLLNYAGPEETFRYVSLSDVLFPEQGEYTIDELKSIFKGKIVLVGDTSIIGKDVLPTPLTQRMPGVEIHANIAQGLLTNNFVHLPTPALTFLFTFVICTLAGIITFILRPLRALPIILFFILALAFLIGYVMFVTRNLWMPFAYTLFGIATNFAIITAYTHLTAERRARQMRDRFGRFVSPAMLHIMVEHPDEALTHPQKMVATLLFTDLRGFTALSERMDAERVVALLDDYFREMTEIIFRYEGTINKFIGDAIFVIFGAPLPMLDHAQRAIQCAVEMQVALDRLRPRLVERGYPELYMRIGIHTGEIVFGEVGKGRQADLTAIGDAVNVASRLEELNKDLGTCVLISETTYELAKDIAVAEPAGTVPIRGRAKPMTVYKLIGLTNGLRIPEPTAKPKLEEVRAASS
ncbi:TPA: adenylate/guanylate cyclase domain-containing protein, partial [Candidatus Bipolaricaulota bacterium]|nr:adenylate/guanylate cyclase domain-containing protein [Candidatus Bipolaricaulota bacterium]